MKALSSRGHPRIPVDAFAEVAGLVEWAVNSVWLVACSLVVGALESLPESWVSDEARLLSVSAVASWIEL